ncbi:MAG: DUF262 domain-containing protein [bacterium]|nr:DUF262 domain-containing protein [bacterium]
MAELSGEAIKLADLFSQRFFFKVPEYQRPFRWTDDNLTDLVTDLLDADWTSDYFLGTIVLHETGACEYDIVDGQQRLTALCLLLACIRDRPEISSDRDMADPLHEKVVQRENKIDKIAARQRVLVREQAFFDKLVGANGGTHDAPSNPDSLSAPEKRYLKACSLFRDAMEDLKKEDLVGFAHFVSQHCTFLYLATPEFKSAFKLFIIVNDRGLQLRRIDVLKSVNLSPDVIAVEKTRVESAHRWEALEERLGEDEFERVFHLMRLALLKEKPQGDLLFEFEEKIFGKPKMPKPGVAFIHSLEKAVEFYDSIFVSRDFLDALDDGTRLAYRALMAIMVDEFKASEWKACCLRYAQKFGSTSFYDFMLAVEKVYMAHWVEGVRKDERYGDYVTILDAIDDESVGAAVCQAIVADEGAVAAACRRENFYSAGFAKYFLLRLEVVASECTVDKHFEARSVEHVLPQTPQKDSTWTKWFTEPDGVGPWVHQAGNLVLLSKSKNSSSSNRDFPDKKEKYLRDRVTDYPRSVQVLEYDRWGKREIKARTSEIAKLILVDPRPTT